MANKLSDIYGIDENSMASRIASDALTNTGGKEDIWGSTIEQSARSKGNTSEPENPDTKSVSNIKNDDRAKSKGNH